jgi:hypothetical protein
VHKLNRKWNQALFKVLGPAQIGDLSLPVPPYDADPICSRCGTRDSAHFMHRLADGKVLCRCPSVGQVAGSPIA